LTSARTLSQSRSRQSSGGATWLYYVMAGVVAGALIFSLIRGLTGSSTFGTAASGEDDNATPAAAVPASTIGKGSAPSRDELYRPAEEPAVAPTLEKSAAPADEPAAAASSTGKAGRVSADQPLGRRGAEGQDSLGPAAPRPARPTVKPATKSDIPAGI
jgi:hypothetical protein